MSITVKFDIDQAGLRSSLGRLRRDQVAKVLQRAVNKTLGNLKAEVNRQVRADRALAKSRNPGDTSTPQKFVAGRLRTIKVGSALGGIQSGRLNISRKGVSLVRYSPRQNKRGVTVRVKRDGSRKLIKHAFIAKLAHGNIHVVARVGRKLKALYSTNIADASTNRMDKIIAYGETQHLKNLTTGIAHALKP